MGAIRGKGGKVATPKPVKVSKSAPKPTRQPSVTKPDQLDKGSGFSEGGEVYVWDGMNWNSQSGKQLGAMEGWKKFTKALTQVPFSSNNSQDKYLKIKQGVYGFLVFFFFDHPEVFVKRISV